MTAMQLEPGSRIPTHISEEARAVARAIDEAVSALLAAHGVVRCCEPAQSELPHIIAKMVQLAINRSFERAAARVDA